MLMLIPITVLSFCVSLLFSFPKSNYEWIQIKDCSVFGGSSYRYTYGIDLFIAHTTEASPEDKNVSTPLEND